MTLSPATLAELLARCKTLLPGAPTTDHIADPLVIAATIDHFSDSHELTYGARTVTVGWLRAASDTLRFTSTLAAEVLRLSGEVERLRAALAEVEETLRLVEHPAGVDPNHGAEVAALGDRIGYGALMSSASASWRKKIALDGLAGGEFVSGPCQITVTRTIR